MDMADGAAAQELGSIAHGPLLLAAVDGVAVGLRCVFAHPTGLHLPIVLLSRGVHADAANRRVRGHGDEFRLELGSADGAATAWNRAASRDDPAAAPGSPLPRPRRRPPALTDPQTGQESRSAGRRAAPSVICTDIPCPRNSRPPGGTMTGSSTQGIKTVLHPVSDLAAAKAVYAALLGVQPQADAPYYVGFEAEGQHIGLVPNGGPQGMTSPVAYWHVPDIEAKLAEVTAAGATVKEPAHDVGGGRLVATVTDPDGNVLGLLQDR
jgi:predicted enzyme related to lactoylglutathione lyase